MSSVCVILYSFLSCISTFSTALARTAEICIACGPVNDALAIHDLGEMNVQCPFCCAFHESPVSPSTLRQYILCYYLPCNSIQFLQVPMRSTGTCSLDTIPQEHHHETAITCRQLPQ